jgi:DNA helicase HerA-like ATPase
MAAEPLLLGKTPDGRPVFLQPGMANRHGLIAGATGTGKTVTLQVLAEGFSRMGVPVFAADVKGDLAGVARPGNSSPKLEERKAKLQLEGHAFRSSPVVFWDLEGKGGHPVRTTVSEMGPLLLARLLELSDAQSDALHLVFKAADDQGLLLLDMKDLKAMLGWMQENATESGKAYGSVSPATLGALQRKLVVLEDQGGADFFGEPALTVAALLRQDLSGQGLVHLLDARTLMQTPQRYATFMLWLLSELFEDLEEVGDLEKPKLVFFFDEAHLLFQDAPPALVQKIEQVVRLVRSKGVGVYFVTQSPADLPDAVLGQLGNRVQHALRAFSARDQKAVKAAAETFPLNPALDLERAITEVGVGEALVSCLDTSGRPQQTERVLIVPPESRIGPLTDEERKEQILRSPYGTQFDQTLDRESAYESLKHAAEQRRAREPVLDVQVPPPLPGQGRQRMVKPESAPRAPARRGDTMVEALGKSVLRSAGSALGRQLIRGVMGSLIKGSRR